MQTQRLLDLRGQRAILGQPGQQVMPLLSLGLQGRPARLGQRPLLLGQPGQQVILVRPGLPEPRLPLLALLDLPAILARPAQPARRLPLLARLVLRGRLVPPEMRQLLLVPQVQLEQPALPGQLLL